MSGLQAERPSIAANSMNPDIETLIFTEASAKFNELAMEIFQHQRENCPPFGKWLSLHDKTAVTALSDIPFLPVSFFKSREVYAASGPAEITFSSSTTSGQTPSLHHVARLSVYQQSFRQGFRHFFGQETGYCWLNLLPGYLERSGSSLVYMADALMQGAREGSDFYLHRDEALLEQLIKNESQNIPTILLGVTFALLELAEKYHGPALKHTLIMETGGMKGRGPELIRAEVHGRLTAAFGTAVICSEYGMTELLSQAYSAGNGLFRCPPWMRVMIQDTGDPGHWLPPGRTGRICVVDLANMYSCSFIATDDLGKMHPDGSFEVLGRFDHSEVRGCNLLVS